MDAISWAILIVAAYLIGSLPTAYLAGRLLKGTDIRRLGDKNAGAANVYHNLGHAIGIAVGVVDIGKGAAAVLLVQALTDGAAIQMAAGIAAVAGHNWPFFLHFRGGRGAATAAGVLMAVVPIAAIPMSLAAFVILLFARNSVVALSFTFIPMPILAWFLGANLTSVAYIILLPIIVGLSHFSSVKRLPDTRPQPVRRPVTHTTERR